MKRLSELNLFLAIVPCCSLVAGPTQYLLEPSSENIGNHGSLF